MSCSTHPGFEAAACHAARIPVLKQQHAHAACMPSGFDSESYGKVDTNCGKKYSLKNLHSTAVKKIQNSPVPFCEFQPGFYGELSY